MTADRPARPPVPARVSTGVRARAGRGIGALTPREAEVLYLLALGHANKAIGRRLGIAPDTVKNHLTAVYAVLGVEGARGAVGEWYRHAAGLDRREGRAG